MRKKVRVAALLALFLAIGGVLAMLLVPPLRRAIKD